MDDLLAFVRAQLDEDERVARAAANEDPPPWHIDEHDGRIKSGPYTVVHIEDSTPQPPVAQHIALHDPARVLAEVAVKRRILDLHAIYADAKYPDSEGGYAIATEDVISLLALPYADRPGYRSEWAPA